MIDARGAHGRRRCLVIHPGALGDVLVALPALAHLGRAGCGFDRAVAAMPRISALLDGSAYAEQALEIDTLRLHRLFVSEPEGTAHEILAGYDAVVSWFGAGDATYRAQLASLGCPVVVARAASPSGSRCHVSRALLDSLAPLGPVPAVVPPVRLSAGRAERTWSSAWLSARHLGRGEAVVLHPGASMPAKTWPGHPALARRLVAAGLPVVIAGGPADAAVVARVVAEGGLSEQWIARDLELRRLAALFEAARLFVGNDSGLTHLAAAVGCPTIALFGPTDPAVWAPGGPPGECPTVRVLAGSGRAEFDPWAGLTVSRVESEMSGLLRATPCVVGRQQRFA